MLKEYNSDHHASFFGYAAREVWLNHDNAEEILKTAVIRYGKERGARMGARAKKDGLPLNMSTYMLYREYVEETEKFANAGSEHLENGDFHAKPIKCPWNTKWTELGIQKYCGIYCRYVDNSLALGFSPDCKLDSTANLPDGAPQCDLWFRNVNMWDPEVKAKMSKYGPLIAKTNAKKTFDYHLAHTYCSLKDSFNLHLTESQTQGILDKAIAYFEQEYGKDSAKAFLAMTNLDFASVDDYVGITVAL